MTLGTSKNRIPMNSTREFALIPLDRSLIGESNDMSGAAPTYRIEKLFHKKANSLCCFGKGQFL